MGSETVAKISNESSISQNASAGTDELEREVPEKIEDVSKEDVLMQDEPQSPEPDFTVAEEKPAPSDSKPDPAPTLELGGDAKMSSADAKPDVGTETGAGSDDQTNAQNGGLQINTATAEDSKSDQKPAEEKAPDTATGDLDSLFNDPISAEDAAAADAFSFDQNNSNEIDFGSFGAGFDSTGADNDNISSLLPGLEDYANTQTNAAADVMDFSSFFNTDDNGQNTGMDQQGSGKQRDTTFDDLMDLANFDGMDGDDNNNNSNNHNADLDFEALFN